MAGEIAHVVYGNQIKNYLGSHLTDTPSFWIGTLLPDIGHISGLSRHRTHPDGVTLATLAGADDFSTGLRVHAWLDATREQYFLDRHTKEELPWHPFVPQALKLLEDDMVYGQFTDWDLIERLLNRPHALERTYVADPATIRRWHALLQAYVREPPSDASRQALLTGIGLTPEQARELASVLARLRRDAMALRLIEDFGRHLADLLH